MKLKNFGLVAVGALALTACEDPLNTDPQASIPLEEGYNTAQKIRAATNGIYDAMQGDGGYGRNLLVFPELFASSNLAFTGTFDTDDEVGNGEVRPSNGSVTGIWAVGYDAINRANSVIANAAAVDDYDADEDRAQFVGEALFMRALNYSNLSRFFGGVPLALEPTTSSPINQGLARATLAQVRAQVETDLEAALDSLITGANSGFSFAPGHATPCAAAALLARTNLDAGDWAEAHGWADLVIDECDASLPESYGTVWQVKNSPESLFELQYTIQDGNNLAFWFFPSFLGGRRGFAPTAGLFNSYAAGDERRDFNIGRYVSSGVTRRYGRKYHRIESNDDNVVVLRLGEMYAIRAEASLRLGEPFADVIADLNVLRVRAGAAALDPSTFSTVAQVETAILNERRREFALEGMRLFDLRRVLGDAGAAAALGVETYQVLFPIPQRELDVNSALTQNPGY